VGDDVDSSASESLEVVGDGLGSSVVQVLVLLLKFLERCDGGGPGFGTAVASALSTGLRVDPDGQDGAPGAILELLDRSFSVAALAGAARAKLSWQRILRRLLAVDHVAEPTYLRPPRRFPDLVGVLPGSRRVPTKLRIMAAIDTSGSMSSATLDEIAAELRVMSRSYDVSVVEFDAVIQRRYRLGPTQPAQPGGHSGNDLLSAMQGRGGTNFHPVFHPSILEWAADGAELSGIVVFTDGVGPAPEVPPREPVIWILTGRGARQPAEWGTAVKTDPGAGANHAQ